MTGADGTVRRSSWLGWDRPAVRALAATLGVSASGALIPFLTGALALQIKRELGASDAAFGAAVSVVFAVGGLGALAGGAVADRVGWRRGMRYATLCSITALLGVAVLARSALLLGTFTAVGGCAMALAGPSGSLAIVRELPATRHGTAFGLTRASAPLMAILAGLSVPVVALTIGWRWAYVIGAAVPVATWLAVPRPDGAGGIVTTGVTPLRNALRDGPLLVFTAASAFAMATVGALTAFVVVASVAAGLQEATAGFLVAAAGGFGLVVRVGAGWVADRYDLGGFLPSAWLLAVGTLGFALIATGQVALLVPGVLLAYGGGWGWTGLMQFGVVTHHARAPASAAGVVQVGMGGGAALGPLGFGLLSDAIGYGPSWWVVAAAGLAASVLVAVGIRQVRVREAEPALVS